MVCKLLPLLETLQATTAALPFFQLELEVFEGLKSNLAVFLRRIVEER
jgi:hypothetical protein